jgi:NAD(P)-dependent dehydrogenase (short-subunit alcohol dehydrogenase family)
MNIVITGGTRGIGFGMAREFLARGHRVAISGRAQDGVERALRELGAVAVGEAVGVVADVTDAQALQRLWDAAAARFGSVEVWINNAGITHRRQALGELDSRQIAEVIDVNLTGTLLGCRVAIAGMLAQGHGRLFNMEGFGSDGLTQPGMAIYGSTKNAVCYLSRALVREYRDTPLVIGTVSPGIVVTELLTRDLYDTRSPEFAARRRFLDMLADTVDTVAPHLVRGVLGADRTGARVRWMGPWQALGRVLKCLVVRRDPFAGDRRGQV